MALRLMFQITTLVLSLAFLVLVIESRIRIGRVRRRIWGVISLATHICIYYIFVILWSTGVFSLATFINDLFSIDWVSFGTWSSAIRFQTAALLVIMGLFELRGAE